MDKLRKKKNPWRSYETEVPHSRCRDPACGVSPAERLSPKQLKLLRKAFTEAQTPPETDGDSRNHRRGGDNGDRGMRFEEFLEVLRAVMGPELEEMWAERFYSEVDVGCAGQVSWKELCWYLLLELRERDRASVPTAALTETQPQIRHCPHNKREPTVRVVAVSHPPPLRYVSVSKGGQVSVWSDGLHVLRSIGLAADPAEEVAHTRRFRGWVTDAVYMGNVHTVAIATDCRDLHFINVFTANIFQEIHLYGFGSVPTALCYWHDAQNPESPALLMVGDQKGGVHLMWFLHPLRGLFEKNSRKQKGLSRIFFPDLSDHSSDMVSHRYLPNVHRDPVTRVMFDTGSDAIVTSSESDVSSVVFLSVTHQREPYIWNISQGVKCFDYSASLQLLVTGGSDRTLRLWSRFVTTRPAAALPGHRAAILDVAIYAPVGQILSYSRDAVLRVWDIVTHQCVKSVRLQFPCLLSAGVPEHGSFPFLLVTFPLPAETLQPHLVVACKDYLALLNLAQTGRGRWWMEEYGKLVPDAGSCAARGGAGGLTCALYNPTLKQVVTGHTDSSVSVWDVETGRKRLQILNAHGEEELLCMTLDSAHRRLITAARNGTIKVWNLLNGLNLHKLEPVTNSAVTRLTCLHDNKLLAVGWSQRIVQYHIGATKDVYVRAELSWKSSGVHRSDILAVCQCPALGVVATGSYDGELVVWRQETQGPVLRLHTDTRAGVAPPVDTLLFLQQRAENRRLRNRGVLVSSQAGTLSFWSITGPTHTYGHFYAPDQPGTRVSSLSSDQLKNSILVSGDATGWLQVWDISDYGLDSTQTSSCIRPPLLQRWRAHHLGLVSVEVVEASDRTLVLSASADGSARLWTEDGHHVGSFGQEWMWNINDSAANQREPERNGTDEEEQEAERDEVRSQETCSCEASPSSRAEDDHNPPEQPLLCEDFSQMFFHQERRRFSNTTNYSSHC